MELFVQYWKLYFQWSIKMSKKIKKEKVDVCYICKTPEDKSYITEFNKYCSRCNGKPKECKQK